MNSTVKTGKTILKEIYFGPSVSTTKITCTSVLCQVLMNPELFLNITMKNGIRWRSAQQMPNGCHVCISTTKIICGSGYYHEMQLRLNQEMVFISMIVKFLLIITYI